MIRHPWSQETSSRVPARINVLDALHCLRTTPLLARTPGPRAQACPGVGTGMRYATRLSDPIHPSRDRLAHGNASWQTSVVHRLGGRSSHLPGPSMVPRQARVLLYGRHHCLLKPSMRSRSMELGVFFFFVTFAQSPLQISHVP